MDRRTGALLAVALALVAFGAVWGLAQNADEKTVVVYDRESRYYRIRVVDYPDQGRRCLHFAKTRGIQSSMLLADPIRLDLRYSRTMIAALAGHEAPKDVLMVGLGGASVPKFLQKHFPEMRLTIVEIDPDVVKVCQEYFHFGGTPNTRVYVMDGRLYLKRAKSQFDVILLDAYAAEHIPFHLTTLEFMALVKARLKPGGLAVSNLWERAVNRFYHAELKTFQETFPQTYLFPAGSSGNIIIVGSASDQKLTARDWVARAKALAGDRDLGFDLAALAGEEYRYLSTQVIREKPLTDDMAPVDTLRHEHPKHFEEEARTGS